MVRTLSSKDPNGNKTQTSAKKILKHWILRIWKGKCFVSTLNSISKYKQQELILVMLYFLYASLSKKENNDDSDTETMILIPHTVESKTYS